MTLYYAAAESALPELSTLNVENILISLANGERQIHKVKDHFEYVNLIIDSGAFTFMNTGGISVKEWIRIVKTFEYIKNKEIIGLDVIGNAKESHRNYIVIRKEIPSIMPTFHVDSEIKYLKKYLEYTDRIAIGGMVPYKSRIGQLKVELNKIFSLFNENNLPKFHAFGYFSQEILENYPFYSCDASTWQNYGRFGEFHKFEKGLYLRMKSPRVEKVSLKGLTKNDIITYSSSDPFEKLKRINEALVDYEIFLTKLWKKRGIKWS